MLKRLFEWYRLVNATPSNETIENRRASVTDLVQRLSREQDYVLLIGFTAAAVNGLTTRFKQDSEVVQAVVEAIRRHQPAFPEDLSENALELRACCAITVGEVLARSSNMATGEDDDALLAAALISTALLIRPPAKEKHLRTMLTELSDAASSVLERGAASRRKRCGVSLPQLEQMNASAELTEFWTGLLPALKQCFTEIEEHAAADREELNVLWWMFTGFSTTANKRLTALRPGAAALCCGGEMANLAITPPVDAIRQMVRRAVETGRRPSELTGQSLKQVVSQWESPALSLLLSDDTVVQEWIQEYPPLFPLSWLCRRLHDSELAADWSPEFERLTGISAALVRPPAEWAVQVFNERIAQRILEQPNED